MIYILNRLPPSYQSFKTSIRTMQISLSLDNLYALLISEEIHLQTEALKFSTIADNQAALYATRGRGRHGQSRSAPDGTQQSRYGQQQSNTCQICKKKGHTADVCWHCLNANYNPTQNAS
ncbi:hypothetical protein KFK09_005598 [Dendrobium nobile]|uniref:Uncharacterized protein n=1 Tax=Dendrobium nobile TaxID=94219 RepID=A0A8T3BW76_DENNO|nr:hypothetical protein KFK09_005598 [Dendrobium nobile]